MCIFPFQLCALAEGYRPLCVAIFVIVIRRRPRHENISQWLVSVNVEIMLGSSTKTSAYCMYCKNPKTFVCDLSIFRAILILRNLQKKEGINGN